MRTLSTDQETVLGLQHRSTLLRVDVYNGSSWVDLTDLEGWDWVIKATWAGNIDNPAETADVDLRARIESLSLMTFDDDSKINASGTLIDMGVRLRIYTATLAMGATPESGDWVRVFDGYIDEVDDTDDPIKLKCRDQGAEPMDTFIESQLTYPASGANDKVENIMQDILDDNNPALDDITANLTWNGTTTVTTSDTSELSVDDYIALNTGSGLTSGPFFEITSIVANTSATILNPSSRTIPSGSGAGDSRIIPGASRITLFSETGTAATPFQSGDSPSWNILQYNQQKIHVLEALRVLANQIGWDVRYTWNTSTSAFELTFFEPDRTKSTPDHTFDQTLYHKITKLAVKRYNVRNAVTVSYDDSSSGVRASVQVTDSTSIAKYGRRAMELALGSGDQIDTSTEANLLANAALKDLKEPTADHGVAMPYFWPVQLGDLYRWTANDVHYTSDQDLAVVSFQHQASLKGAQTTLMTRGTPAGGFKRWIQMEARLGVAQASDVKSLAAPSGVAATAGIEGIIVTYDDPLGYTPPVKDWAYTECYVHTSDPGATPSSSYLMGTGRQTRFEIRGLFPGITYYARLILYDRAGNKSAASSAVSAAAGRAGAVHMQKPLTFGGWLNGNARFLHRTRG